MLHWHLQQQSSSVEIKFSQLPHMKSSKAVVWTSTTSASNPRRRFGTSVEFLPSSHLGHFTDTVFGHSRPLFNPRVRQNKISRARMGRIAEAQEERSELLSQRIHRRH